MMKEFFSLQNIFFEIGGQGISYLEFFGVLLGLASVFLAGLARSVNYWIGFVYVGLLFLMFLQKRLYTNMLLQPVSLGINVYGLYSWTRPGDRQKNERNQLLTTFLTTDKGFVRIVAFGFVPLGVVFKPNKIWKFSACPGTFLRCCSGRTTVDGTDFGQRSGNAGFFGYC